MVHEMPPIPDVGCRRDLANWWARYVKSTWHNALCHGIWFGVDSDGTECVAHFYRKERRVLRFQSRVTLKEPIDLRARIVDTIFKLVEVSGVVGSNSALPTVMRRMYEPLNVPPALKLSGDHVSFAASPSSLR